VDGRDATGCRARVEDVGSTILWRIMQRAEVNGDGTACGNVKGRGADSGRIEAGQCKRG
jgi:hypothetical protein